MILQSRQDNTQIIGDIKQFKTSIDIENFDFITTLLSSNLYSNPEKSFIREIVSNAWDSHIEAGTTDIPIIIVFAPSENEAGLWDISIRDFGTGLSPQRFEKIFCNLGSSTKRASNDFIGGFGIGRFSSLACSDTVYITSYYNGVEYSYVMVKSNNQITSNLISTRPTNEKNGVTITLKNRKNVWAYKRALNYITYFPNVYVEGVDNNINTVKVRHYNTFAVCSNPDLERPMILLGNVLYPCKEDFISKGHNCCFGHIALKFEIGELEVTPNRESLIYTEATIKKINDRREEMLEEMESLVKKETTGDYDDLYKLWEVTKLKVRYDLMSGHIADRFDRSVLSSFCTTVDLNTLTFKKKPVSNKFVNNIQAFFSSLPPNFKGYIDKGRIYNKDSNTTNYNVSACDNKFLIIKDLESRFPPKAKEWLAQNYDDYTIMSPFTKQTLRRYLALEVCPFVKSLDDRTVDSVYDYLMSKAKIITLATDKSFLEYKKSRTEALKGTQTKLRYVHHLHVYTSDKKTIYTFKDLPECIEYLKKLKKGVLLVDMKADSELYDIAKYRNMILVRASKDTMSQIKSCNLPFIVDAEKILSDKVTIRHSTIARMFPDKIIQYYYVLCYLCKILPSPLREDCKDITELYTGLARYRHAVAHLCQETDPQLQATGIKLLEYADKIEKMCSTFGWTFQYLDSMRFDLLAAAVMKTKAFRINYDTYKKLNKNPILHLLCGK